MGKKSRKKINPRMMPIGIETSRPERKMAFWSVSVGGVLASTTNATKTGPPIPLRILNITLRVVLTVGSVRRFIKLAIRNYDRRESYGAGFL